MIDFKKYTGAMDLPDSRDFTTEELVGALPQIELPKSVVLDITPVLNQGNRGACHDDKTEVLTDAGWKFFKNISKDDSLATVAPETQEVYFEKPTAIISYHYVGKMIYGNHNKLNFMVTPDHNMLVRKWNEKNRTLNKQYEFVKAGDIGWYSGMINKVTTSNKGNEFFIIKGTDNKTNCKQRHEKIIPMETWLMFLGIFIAEGTLCYDAKRKQYKIQIAGVKDREREFIKAILDDMGIVYTSLKDRFTFNNKQIFDALANDYLGIKAPQKRVPKYVFDESITNIKAFLLGHFMGDGTVSSGRNVHYTTSQGLADDLFTLTLLSGDTPYINKTPPRIGGIIKGRQIVSKHENYSISANQKKPLAIDKKEHITQVDYDGIVYCAEVPTYHTLITRRENKVLVSGNCTVFGSSGTWFETLAQIMDGLGEKYVQPFDPWTVWDEALKRGASDTQGWYIQSALQLLTDMKLIGGYIKIGDYGNADWYTIAYWLTKRYAIVTGTAKGDWGKVVTTGRYHEQSGTSGHCFQINRFHKNLDEKKHIGSPNSWNGVGDFWMDFDTYGKKLFTQYIIIPTSEVELLKEIKGKRRLENLEKAREYKIWNEQRGSDLASAFEISKMIENAGFGGKARGYYGRLFADKILRGKAKVWNQKEVLRKPTEDELAIMFTRAALKDPTVSKLSLTREQVAIIIARDLL